MTTCKGWMVATSAIPNIAYEVLFAHANPPRYDHAALQKDEDFRGWVTCSAGWLRGMPCILEYIDEIDAPTHIRELLEPPIDERPIDERGV